MTATVEPKVGNRQVADMASDVEFDPLVDLAGMWTVELAERYLPIPGAPVVRYECWDGRLLMAPYEAARNSHGAIELAVLLRPGAKAAGLHVYGTVNLTLGRPDRWIQPDLAILTQPQYGTAVPVQDCLLPIEFISPSSRRRDRIDKPAALAELGVPWYMTVELAPERDLALVELSRLVDGAYQLVNRVTSGQRMVLDEPFAADFDPADLLDR